MALFRAGNEEAFRVIHDRYRKRLLAYTRQMLAGSGQDPEDVLQDVLERAYCGLRASDRDLALKAWLYRVAHNRCIDQLRRPIPVGSTAPDDTESRQLSPAAMAEQREALRRLIVDVQRLPDQQRSALLLREMSGMSYADLAGTLGVSVPAVKSLLVRARISLVAASEARDTDCRAIREELALCHDAGVRPSGLARRHLRDCEQCGHFKRSVHGMSRSLAAITPAAGPMGVVVKLLSGGGVAGSGGVLGSSGAAGGATVGGAAAGGAAGGAAAGGAAAGGAAGGAAVGGAAVGTAASGAAVGGTVVSTGALAGGFAAGTAGHVATLVAAALVTAGGAVAVQQASTPAHSKPQATLAHHLTRAAAPFSGGAAIVPSASAAVAGSAASQPGARTGSVPKAAGTPVRSGTAAHRHRAKHHRTPSAASGGSLTAQSNSPVDPTVSSTATYTSSPTGASTTGASSSGTTSSTGDTSTTTTATSTQSTGGAALAPPSATGGASGSTSGS